MYIHCVSPLSVTTPAVLAEHVLKTSDSTLSALAPAASVLRALPIGPREGVAGSSAASATASSVWLKARCGWAASAVMTRCWRRLSAGLRARSATAGRQQRALLCPLGYLQFGLSGFINIDKSIDRASCLGWVSS